MKKIKSYVCTYNKDWSQDRKLFSYLKIISACFASEANEDVGVEVSMIPSSQNIL
jgi:hypothetical protein